MATLSSIIAWKINPMDRGPWWATVYEVADVHVHMPMCTHTHTHTHRVDLQCYASFRCTVK